MNFTKKRFEPMKNYLVEALALQLEGETENLRELHGNLKSQLVPTTNYTEAAEKLLDATNALYSVVFDLVSTIWNINRPAEHPLKSFPRGSGEQAVQRLESKTAAGVRRDANVESLVAALKAMPEPERQSLLAKLYQSTKQS